MLRTVSQLSSAEPIRVLVDGEEPGELGLRHPALINYGHFTAMQVRAGRVRGLNLHLERIERSHRMLFANEIDTDLVRVHLRTALEEMSDCYLRVVFFEVEPGVTTVMTVQRPPVAPAITPVSLMPVAYQRAVPEVKHMGSFSKIYHSVLAQRAGFDDAVHTTDDGLISETTGANIGFLDGDRIVWPSRPSLPGITWALLETALAREGTDSVREPVNVRDVERFDAAFLSNSVGIAPVGRIGDTALGDAGPVVSRLNALYDAASWDEI